MANTFGKRIPLQFRPKANLMRLIGENLLKDEVTAVLELVKNAHDADASKCIVKIETIDGKQQIIIDDTGDGMDKNTITKDWMEPGSSKKKKETITKKKRRVLGEKGIGRFATDKLAKNLTILTKTKDMKNVIQLTVSWEDFHDKDEKGLYLDNVNVFYEIIKKEFKNKGTTIMLTDLRKNWERKDVEAIKFGLTKLRSPLKRDKSFEIVLESGEYPDLSGIIENKVIEEAPFSINANLTPEGTITAVIQRNLPWDNSSQEKIIQVHEFRGRGILSSDIVKKLGPLEISIGAYLRTKHTGRSKQDVITDISISKEREKSLENWHGISIYSDGFWLYPFGESWYDWLGLDRRRILSPGTRFDNVQVSGFVNITQDANPLLVQQVNREGLYHNEGYGLLQAVTLSVLSALESDSVASGARKKQNTKTNEVIASSNISETTHYIKDVITGLTSATSYLKKGDSKNALDELETSVSKIKNLQKEIEKERVIFDRFALLGQLIGYVIHEISDVLEPVSLSLDTLRNLVASIKSNDPHLNNEIMTAIRNIENDFINISAQIDRWSPFVTKKEKREKIELCKYLKFLQSEFQTQYDEFEIKLECDNDAELIISKVDLWTIMHNLIDNAHYWTKNVKDPTVTIKTERSKNQILISVQDNGPGISDADKNNIFIPGWSGKPDGSGLGLVIAANSAWRLNGELSYIIQESGSMFELKIPWKDQNEK